MTDSQKLKEFIRERGYTVRSLAEMIGISHEALYQKIANERAFKASEIMKISDVLGMTAAERDEIFFANNVRSQRTERTEQ